MKRFLIIVLTSLSLTLTLAEIRYVSKTGGSKPPYTSWETASDSIQKCINLCFNGDTVVVANGIYQETLVIDSSITLIGSSMDSCIIDVRGFNTTKVVQLNNDGISISGFNVTGNPAVINQTSISVGEYSVSIRDCRISSSVVGIGIQSGLVENVLIEKVDWGIDTFCYTDSCKPIVRNCVIITNSNSGQYGFYASWGGQPCLIGNIIIAKGYASGGIGFGMVKKLTAINNLVAGFNKNIRAGLGVDSVFLINNICRDYKLGLSPFGSIHNINNKTILYNNIITNNDIGIHIYSSPAVSDYNLFWNNQVDVTNSTAIGEHDVFADPMFIKDTLARSMLFDYHLQKYSPAIDSGNPDVYDSDGSRSDIGMYGGPLGISYTYTDLPPRPPKNFRVTVDTTERHLVLEWDKYSESDFSHYNIYRSTEQGFIPGQGNKISETDTSVFTDTIPFSTDNIYYRVTGIDSSLQESIPGPEIAVVILDSEEPLIRIVEEYQLYQNYPNPFNGETVIPYSLKERAIVKIMLYDITGELISQIENSSKDAGYNESRLDASGMNLSSGIYLYRIEVTGDGMIPRYMQMRKMIYLK